jgi:hypothetical protein
MCISPVLSFTRVMHKICDILINWTAVLFISVFFVAENQYVINMSEIYYSILLQEKMMYFNFYEKEILIEHTKFYLKRKDFIVTDNVLLRPTEKFLEQV